MYSFGQGTDGDIDVLDDRVGLGLLEENEPSDAFAIGIRLRQKRLVATVPFGR